jgi:hypothetical protein
MKILFSKSAGLSGPNVPGKMSGIGRTQIQSRAIAGHQSPAKKNKYQLLILILVQK